MITVLHNKIVVCLKRIPFTSFFFFLLGGGGVDGGKNGKSWLI